MSASAAGDLDALHHADEFVRHVGQQADRLDGLLLQLEEARLDFRPGLVGCSTIATRATRNGQPSRNSSTRKRVLALHDEVMPAVLAGDVAHDRPGRADPVQVVRRDVVLLGVALQQEADALLGLAPLPGPRRRKSRGRS